MRRNTVGIVGAIAIAAGIAGWWLRASDERVEPLEAPREGVAAEAPESRASGALRRSEVAPSPAPAPDPADGRALRFVVVDADARPVDGAEVQVYERGFARWNAGETDAHGVLVIEAAKRPEGEARAVALHVGYSPQGRLFRPADEALTITLHPADTIAGQVEFAGAPLRVAGVRVLAEDPANARMDATRVVDLDDPELGLLGARTDAEGRFEIRGVRADRAYYLYAGGSGYWSRDRQGVGFTGRDAVVIEVERLYGAITRFVEEDGTELELPWSFQHAQWARSVFAEDQTRREDSTSVDAQVPFIGLSGIDPKLITALPTSWGLVLESTRMPYPRMSPRVDTGSPPGFDEYRVTYELWPLETGLNDVAIPLRRRPEGYGALRVRLVDAATGTDVDRAFAPVPGTLQLYAGRSEELAGCKLFTHSAYEDPKHPGGWTVLWNTGQDEELVARDVPCGTYAARYESRWSGFEYPPRGEGGVLVSIAEGITELTIPVEPAGSVQLEFVTEEGAPFEVAPGATTRVRKTVDLGERPN